MDFASPYPIFRRTSSLNSNNSQPKDMQSFASKIKANSLSDIQDNSQEENDEEYDQQDGTDTGHLELINDDTSIDNKENDNNNGPLNEHASILDPPQIIEEPEFEEEESNQKILEAKIAEKKIDDNKLQLFLANT